MSNDNMLYDFRDWLIEDIRILKSIVYEKENNLKKINNEIINSCTHEWIVDYIDKLDGYKESVMIKYCKKCEQNFIPNK